MKQITIEEFKKFLDDHLSDYIETVIKECEKNKDENPEEWVDPLWNERLNSLFFSDLMGTLCKKTVEDSVEVGEDDVILPPDSEYLYLWGYTSEYADRVYKIVKEDPRYKEIEKYNHNKYPLESFLD